jgi:phage recombination protein Bet
MSAVVEKGQLSQEQVDLVRRTICRDATDDELRLFLTQCNRTGLDPFSRQIHAVKRWDSREKREVMTIQVGIDGFRLVADRTKETDGQDGPYWCGPDGNWVDVWLGDTPPSAARVLVYRKGRSRPYAGVAHWSECVQTTGKGEVTRFWQRMPALMLAKVAEALALRKAFPQELSGLYTAEELGPDPDAAEERRPAPPKAAPIALQGPALEAPKEKPNGDKPPRGTISEQQFKLLVILCEKTGYGKPELQKEFGLLSRTQLSREQASALISRLNEQAQRGDAEAGEGREAVAAEERAAKAGRD